jgi:flagellar biosynthetic protein FliP
MNPVITDINEQAYTPYAQGEISQEEAVQRASEPLREFMLKQTKNQDLNLFLSLSGSDSPENFEEIDITVLIPAFITSELKRAFIIGFLIYLPFLVIDIVVASTLMSMGMVMLSPAMISLPFKIMLFVLVDGWELVVKTLILSFNY